VNGQIGAGVHVACSTAAFPDEAKMRTDGGNVLGGPELPSTVAGELPELWLSGVSTPRGAGMCFRRVTKEINGHNSGCACSFDTHVGSNCCATRGASCDVPAAGCIYPSYNIVGRYREFANFPLSLCCACGGEAPLLLWAAAAWPINQNWDVFPTWAHTPGVEGV